MLLKRKYEPKYALVPNIFIEKYMKDVQGDILKVYLWLLRLSEKPAVDISVADLADRLDCMEKDVRRALKSLEKRGIIRLDYENGQISGIVLAELDGQEISEVPDEQDGRWESKGSEGSCKLKELEGLEELRGKENIDGLEDSGESERSEESEGLKGPGVLEEPARLEGSESLKGSKGLKGSKVSKKSEKPWESEKSKKLEGAKGSENSKESEGLRSLKISNESEGSGRLGRNGQIDDRLLGVSGRKADDPGESLSSDGRKDDRRVAADNPEDWDGSIVQNELLQNDRQGEGGIDNSYEGRGMLEADHSYPQFDMGSDPGYRYMVTAAESYLGRTLTPTDIALFDRLHTEYDFSYELIEYLIEYCVELGKKSNRYIETVALSWVREGKMDIAELKEESKAFRKENRAVMKAFGITGRMLGDKERSFVDKWLKEQHFTLDVVIEACDHTMTATRNPSFEYTDAILAGWKDAGVVTVDDAKRVSEEYKSAAALKYGKGNGGKGTSSKGGSSGKAGAPNRFHNFEQRNIDYDALLADEIGLKKRKKAKPKDEPKEDETRAEPKEEPKHELKSELKNEPKGE